MPDRDESVTATCGVCGESHPATTMLTGASLRHAVSERIRGDHPAFGADSRLCPACNARYRADYVRDLIEDDRGELTTLEDEVVAAMREQELIASNLNKSFGEKMTFGERVADQVAAFGGSWTFIILFAAIITVWISVNAAALVRKPFDPYPFILLNLVLSTLAALQAPVIMMSQNRQSAKDRLQADHDYRVNLKAELEVRLLHGKLDQLVSHQWQRLIEIQQVQMDLIEELRGDRGAAGR